MIFEYRTSPSGGKPDPLSELAEEQERWRAKILRALRPTTAVIGALELLFVVVVMDNGMQRLLCAAGAALLVLASLAPRLRSRTRTWLVTLSLTAVCVLGIPQFGFAPTIFGGLLLAVLVANLFLNRWERIGNCLLVAAALSAMGIGLATGMVEVAPYWSELLDPKQPLNVLRVLILFGVQVIVLYVILGHIGRGVLVLLEQKTRALASLLAEMAEGERLRRKMACRDNAARSARELEQLGRLASFFCHDTNNCLQLIWSVLPVLRDFDRPAAERAEALATLAQATQQIRGICSQLRVFEPESEPSGARDCDLAVAVPRAVRMLRHLLPDGISVLAGDVIAARIPLDEIELQRVLVNLALNARDAMGDRGKLTITCRAATAADLPVPSASVDGVIIEVEDSGPGIPDELVDRIFEPFFTTKGAQGSGLGLASVRAFVRACGGRVAVVSEPGKGAKFSVFLPPAGTAPAEPGSLGAVPIEERSERSSTSRL